MGDFLFHQFSSGSKNDSMVVKSLFVPRSKGGSRGADPVPDEWSDEVAATIQTQDAATQRTQQAELHSGGREEETTIRQSGASGLPTA